MLFKKKFKKILLSTFFTIAITLCYYPALLFSQDECIAAPTTAEELEYLSTNDPYYDTNYSFNSSLPRYDNIPITFHVFPDSFGVPLATETEINLAIEELNNSFNAGKMGFSSTQDYSVYDLDSGLKFGILNTLDATQISELPYLPNSINIYVIDSIVSSVGSNILGFSTFPSGVGGLVRRADVIFIKSGHVFNNYNMSHEVGHFFGLMHTFTDVDCTPGFCQDIENCSEYLEVNSYLEGDRCSDTEPIIKNSLVNSNCEIPCLPQISNSSFSSLDNDDYYNVMSYNNCKQTFTTDQYRRMYWYLTNGRPYLLSPQSNLSGLYLLAPYGITKGGFTEIPVIFYNQNTSSTNVKIEVSTEGTNNWEEIRSVPVSSPSLVTEYFRAPIIAPNTSSQSYIFRISSNLEPNVFETTPLPVIIVSPNLNQQLVEQCDLTLGYSESLDFSVSSVVATDFIKINFTWEPSSVPSGHEVRLFSATNDLWNVQQVQQGIPNTGNLELSLPLATDLSDVSYILRHGAIGSCAGSLIGIFGFDYDYLDCTPPLITSLTGGSCSNGSFDINLEFSGVEGPYTIFSNGGSSNTPLIVNAPGQYLITDANSEADISIIIARDGDVACSAEAILPGRACTNPGVPNLFVSTANAFFGQHAKMKLDGNEAQTFSPGVGTGGIDFAEGNQSVYHARSNSGDVIERDPELGNFRRFSPGATGGVVAVSGETEQYFVTDNSNRIYYGSINGGARTRIIGTEATAISVKDELGKAFWFQPRFGPKIRSRDLVTGMSSTVFTPPNAPTEVYGLDVDLENEYIYWCSASSDEIYRVKLDGTGYEVVLGNLSNPYDLVISPATNQVFWTSSSNNRIMTAALNGENPTPLPNQPVAQPRGIAICFSCGDVPECPPGDVTLTTQEEVNDFVTNYPDCTEIDGSLIIGEASGGRSSTTQITDLSGLSGLRFVTGNLTISNNNLLADIGFLANIESLGGILTISNNSNLNICSEVFVCSLIDSDPDVVAITNNATGCNNSPEVSNECASLPVNLIRFTATTSGKTSVLSWETSLEENNSGFHIQRLNSTQEIQEIGWVPANSQPSTYTFVDNLPYPGENLYRLAQEDHNGTITNSPLRMVLHRTQEDLLIISPNPANQRIKVLLNGAPVMKEINIFSLAGQLVGTFQGGAPLPVHQLPTGIYILRAKHRNKVLIQRFVVDR